MSAAKVGAAAKAGKGASGLTALMWAHWRGSTGVATLLTGRGRQLTNADLEGLQRLRELETQNSPQKPQPTPTDAGGAAEEEGAEGKDVTEDDMEPPDAGVLALGGKQTDSNNNNACNLVSK